MCETDIETDMRNLSKKLLRYEQAGGLGMPYLDVFKTDDDTYRVVFASSCDEESAMELVDFLSKLTVFIDSWDELQVQVEDEFQFDAAVEMQPAGMLISEGDEA